MVSGQDTPKSTNTNSKNSIKSRDCGYPLACGSSRSEEFTETFTEVYESDLLGSLLSI